MVIKPSHCTSQICTNIASYIPIKWNKIEKIRSKEIEQRVSHDSEGCDFIITSIRCYSKQTSWKYFKKQCKRWVYHWHQNICLWEDEFLFKRESCLYKWVLVSLETSSQNNTTYDSRMVMSQTKRRKWALAESPGGMERQLLC